MTRELQSQLRPLRRQLSTWWIAGWAVCVLSLGTLAVVLRLDLARESLDSQLSLYATATYGLSWFDEHGDFHGELLSRDDELANAPFDIWIIQPGQPPKVYRQPEEPILGVGELADLATQAMEMDASFHIPVRELQGGHYRVQLSHVFREGTEEIPYATILVVGDASAIGVIGDRFLIQLLSFCAVLLVGGIAFGLWLTNRNLAPVAKALHERERFLAAAAHELRTPLTQLRAVAESELHANDSETTEALSKQTLLRIRQLVDENAEVVENLLQHARLQSDSAPFHRETLRLDLLIESLQPAEVQLELGGDDVTVDVDLQLFTVLIRNLFRNASNHVGGKVQIDVAENRLEYRDNGPGFQAEVLQNWQHRRDFVHSAGGVGLGLTLMRQIIEAHGGSMELSNHPDGGAVIVLRDFGAELS